MLTIISTGDRESDLYRWHSLKEKVRSIEEIISIDGSTEVGLHQLTQRLETISLLTEIAPIVAHHVKLTTELVKLLVNYEQDVFLLTPEGKLPTLNSPHRIINEKLTDSQLKSVISHSFEQLSFVPAREDLIRIYSLLTSEDFMGKERISPNRTLTFIRQVRTLEGTTADEGKKLLTALLGSIEGKFSQWEILDHLFTPSKRKQKEYFAALTEIMSTYEIMSLAKSTLLLVLAIIVGQEQHLDATSIATKIGKHPFYVSSLLRTITSNRIAYEKAFKLCTRLFNLESALKSGRFDDEGFGFDVLLATEA